MKKEHKDILSTIFKLAVPAALLTMVASDKPGEVALPPPLHDANTSPLRTLLQSTESPAARNQLIETFRASCVSPKAPTHYFARRNNVFAQLKGNGPFSTALYAQAQKRDIVACPTGEAKASRSYDPAYKLIYTTKNAGQNQQTWETVHGLMHAYMNEGTAAKTHPRELLFSRISRGLTVEATAIVAEFTAIAEDSSTPNAEIARENPQYGGIFTRALDFYKSKGGKTGEHAVEYAASYTINKILRDPAFISKTSDNIFKDYIAEAMSYNSASAPLTRFNFDGSAARGLGTVGSGYNITRTVNPLSEAEYAQLSPVGAQTVNALENMRAQKFSYATPVPLSVKNPYSGVKLQAVADQINLSKGIYTTHQAIARAQNANVRSYSTRARVMDSFLSRGFQNDYTADQLPEGMQNLWASMQSMRLKSPVFGRALFEYTARANVFICASDLSPTVVAEWQNGPGSLRVRTDVANSPQAPSMEAHEAMHAIQDNYNLRPYSASRSIWDRQAMLLNIEAGSKAAESVIALEYALHGDDAPAKNIQNPEVYKIVKAVYDQTLADGATYTDALAAGGAAGWNAAYSMQWWLNAYNVSALADHVWFVTHDSRLQAPDATPQFTVALARMSGQASVNFNYTKGLQALPSRDAMFGSNKEMRQAFDYVNYVQLQKTLGDAHARTQSALHQIKADKNPFVGIDLNAALQDQGKYENANILQVLKFKAGIAPQPALKKPPTNNKTEPAKPFCV